MKIHILRRQVLALLRQGPKQMVKYNCIGLTAGRVNRRSKDGNK